MGPCSSCSQGGGPQSSSSPMPPSPSHPLYRTDSKTLVKRRDPAALPNRPKDIPAMCLLQKISNIFLWRMPICTSDASAQPLGESENHCHLLHFFVVVFSSIWFCTTCIFEVKGLTVSNIIYKATNIWYKHCPQWRYRCQKNCWPLGKGEGQVQIHSKQINMQSDKCQEENSNEVENNVVGEFLLHSIVSLMRNHLTTLRNYIGIYFLKIQAEQTVKRSWGRHVCKCSSKINFSGVVGTKKVGKKAGSDNKGEAEKRSPCCEF